MRRVLLVPCGTEIANEIVRSLKDIKNISVYGANSINCYSYINDKNIDYNIPLVDEDDFINSILELENKWGITHIIPAHDSSALKLTENRHLFKSKIVSSSFETNNICRSKTNTYEKLKNIIRVPKVYNKNTDEYHYPLFIKPDIGQGSVGTRLVKSSNELDLKSGDLLCEFLPGEEYTIDCLTDPNGVLIYSKARKRCRMRNGIAVETKLVDQQIKFQEIAKKINLALDLRGAWFFQVKEASDGELCLLEVATRIAGSMVTSRFNGINFAELSILVSDDIPISIIDNNLPVTLYRNLNVQFKSQLDYDVIYTDYDDCLLFSDGRVNYQLLAFLYHGINNGKKIILITRHDGDLKLSLSKYRLNNVFDSIIHINDRSKKKSEFINNSKSIFIDDSFKERKDVYDKFKIPCFSVDMIDGLLCLKN
ncbi:ATP-grasp domain-containing protein [Photobacterium piscicola]|uniref:ATP-grasp domain-containing protein n=1 Tax=Photobacterium piscicola TaxID=1378299 RepID=UPI002E183300|nr:ATP-grasp domain-containing protein [Photobacterium piscicola]